MAKVFLRITNPDGNSPQPTPKKIKIRVKKEAPLTLSAYNAYEKDINENLPAYDKDARSFYTQYLNSPLYRARLMKQGYTDPDAAIKLRLANLGVTKTEKGIPMASEYNQPEQKVVITPYDKLTIPQANVKAILAHELSHVVGAMNPYNPKFPFPMTMNPKEESSILNRNKLYNIDASKLSENQKEIYMHDIQPQESKADLDTLRYKLFSDKIYDAGTQQFTKEHLKKAKEKYGSDLSAQRLFNYFSDDDIIWMMNNIAKNDTNNTIQSTTA